ncbi:ICME [Symbiodinium necroappetens]|uniref:ICME protein n=1 Tax=Symbiodinium necroappetens TaxID=1628268 RepID=A0A812MJR5_9DINO|nr:ICME [Symbiodinium necroappetens]
MAAQDEFAGEYQALADPESATAPGEAKHFKQILKHAATAAGDSQTTGNKEDLLRLRRVLAAKKERERRRQERGGQGHSFWYSLVSSHSHRTEVVAFRHIIATVIVVNVICFIIQTDKETDRKYKALFNSIEAASSWLFLGEYLIRLMTIHENKRYHHLSAGSARLVFLRSFSSIVDLVSFLPWFVEQVVPYELPNLQCIRVIRLFRLFKSNSVMSSVDVIARVLYFNSEILCVAFMIDAILILFTSTVLYYMAPPPDTPGVEDDFESIPATMYLSVMMLTGQGQPSGQLPWYTKAIVVATAVLATAQFAIPASMLTWGFEQEAERRLQRNHELQLKQRDKILQGDSAWNNTVEISSSSTSESEVGHEWAEYEAVVVGSDSEEEGGEISGSSSALSASEAARIAKIFSTLDADENGTLVTAELCQLSGGRVDGQNLADVLDADGDGKTTSTEFLEWLANIKSKNVHVFNLVLSDLEKLRPLNRREVLPSSLDALAGQVTDFAQHFRDLTTQVKQLQEQLAAKDRELEQLRSVFVVRMAGKLLWALHVSARCFYLLARLLLFIVLLLPVFIRATAYCWLHPSVANFVRYGPKRRHLMDIYMLRPEFRDAGPRPVVVFFTGGVWIIGYKMWGMLMGMVLQRLGILLIVPDYRNFPQATGEEMVEDSILAVQWSLDHCEDYGGDPSRIFLVGQSAGAHLLAMALIRRATGSEVKAKALPGIHWKPKDISAFVGISGPFDLVDLSDHFHSRGLDRRLLSSIFEGRLEDFSPTRQATRDLELPPVLLVHGTADTSVPSRSAVHFAAALQAAGVEAALKLYPGKSHTDPILEDPIAGNDPLIEELAFLVRSNDPRRAMELICERVEGGQEVVHDNDFPTGTRMMPMFVIQLARMVNPF